MQYHAANLSIENRPDENLNLALRPVISPEQPWPFPRGCSLAARGFWPTRVASPVFMIQDLYEVADAPGHTYERSLPVVVFQDNPQPPRLQRINNALTRELAHEFDGLILRNEDHSGARELLAWTDVLVDGPYESANPDRRRNWVGSTNQRFHYLTRRYDASIEGADAPNREVEWRIRDDGRFVVNGWPVSIR